MTRITIVGRNGDETVAVAADGLSVMEVIRGSGSDEVLALCGGCCSCATCHVYVDEAFAGLLPPLGADEDELLDSTGHRTARSRLSCQIPCSTALDGLRVEIAPPD